MFNHALPFRQWLPSSFRMAPEGGQIGDFLDGLGPGQLVGRQVLGSPCLGDIQLTIIEKNGQLEVEVVRAKGLIAKPGSKMIPGKTIDWIGTNVRDP